MVARISCSRTSKVTCFSAFTPPKDRVMPSRPRTTSPIILPPFTPAPSRSLFRRRGRIDLRFLDAQVGADLAAAPVLELDLRLDELRRLARVERVDQHAVLLRDETAAHLARARQLVVIRIEFLVQDLSLIHIRIAPVSYTHLRA